ncbi:MAG: hypothetical protein DIU61_002140 [Bacteroidota bacterium]|jgi:hypothetical protein|nr:MAG: hypothetical protein DIU61_14695 [Bacteroidota bacterium]
MATCPTGKRAYLSEEIAVEVLIGAWVHYDRSRGDGPVAIYRCDDCGQYHLTSKGPMHETLKKYLADGTISRMSQAEEWMQRLKRKGS